MEPNFFKFATNELSQDAFFCWLIEWSSETNKKKNPDLQKASLSFIKHIIPEEFTNDFCVNTCKVYMQKKNTDFIIELNNSILMHFEDKVKSSTSHRQLSTYKEVIAKEFSNHNVYNIYLKTDLIWSKERKIIDDNGYRVFDLLKINEILQASTNSDIYDNFTTIIQQRLDQYFNYKNSSLSNWTHSEWIGFLYDLSLETRYHNFEKYFVGKSFWFVFSWFRLRKFNNSHISFEIINKKCAIKAHVYDKTVNRGDVLKYVKELFSPIYKDFKTKQYNRKGKSMLVIEFTDFMMLNSCENISFKETKERLLKINQLFEEVINNVG